jgi:uncharacterized protein YyaL (SSP411 family)
MKGRVVSRESSIPNRLAGEKSPYLLQHAFNPVDWYPWSEEAFERARQEDKPIFLSIGYSTCHWCHVMEHESFEDPQVAHLMNETFVCIKVDREERPDIDKAYMQVAQVMTGGGGGWPLTIFMSSNKRPFYAAAYIPKDDSYGQIGLLKLLPRIQELWKSNRSNIDEVTRRVAESLSEKLEPEPHVDMDVSSLNKAYESLSQRFDENRGGFGTAPKFPSPHNLMFLLRYFKRTRDERALYMVEKTLKEMRKGGIFDQIGFGFHRYSTDSEWLVPHFEKMLYDQALLIIAYTEAFQQTGDQVYAQVVREIAEYLQRDMKSPEGAFYSAQDADSEGEEGKYYLWSQPEILSLLNADEAIVVQGYFGITPEGNFTDRTSDDSTGKNILYVAKNIDELADDLGVEANGAAVALEKARHMMLDFRSKRIRPQKDDKILADWNGLAVAALAIAGRALGDDRLTTLAREAMAFVMTRMQGTDGALFHRYRDGETAIPAFLDDYAFVVWGLIELYETTFDPQYLEAARDLNDLVLKRFWDKDQGGFILSLDSSEQLPGEHRDAYDGALPSGNSVSVMNMTRLARLLGDEELEDRAAKTLSAFAEEISQSYAGHTMMLAGLDYALGPSYEIVVAGTPKAEETLRMVNAVRNHFVPSAILILRGEAEQVRQIDRIAPYTKFYGRVDNQTTAYVCIDHKCMPPTTEVAKMLKLLSVNS